jgi:hypothetical protein
MVTSSGFKVAHNKVNNKKLTDDLLLTAVVGGTAGGLVSIVGMEAQEYINAIPYSTTPLVVEATANVLIAETQNQGLDDII